MTSLIICRHGNTFAKGDPPRRVGKHTDIPLTQSGQNQAIAIGRYLAEKSIFPDQVICSSLQRTAQTARLALDSMNLERDITQDPRFDEIDYGPDENKTEDQVIARIGQEAITLWDRHATPPPGWKVDPEKIKQDWMDFADNLITSPDNKNPPEKTVMVVTSNGIGRFAPYITGDYQSFVRHHNIKMKTGSISIFEYDGANWQAIEWNTRPA